MNEVEVYNQFFSTLVDGDVEETVRAAYRIFERPIIVLDEFYQILSLYPKHEIGEPIFDAIRINKKIPLQMVAEFKNNFYMSDVLANEKPFYLDWGMVKDNPRIIGRFGSGKEIKGYIGIVYRDNDVQPCHLEWAHIFCMALSVQVKSAPHPSDCMNPLIAPFLEELFHGAIQSREHLERWLALVPIALDPTYCILNAVPLRMQSEDKMTFPYISRAFAQLYPNCLIHISDDNLIALLSKVTCSDETGEMYSPQMKRILAILKEFEFQCGISEAFDNLLHAPQFLHQAKQAVSIGNSREPQKDIHSFRDYAPLAIAKNLLQSSFARAYIHPAFSVTAAYDEKYDTEYFATLVAFFMHFKEKNRTAKALNIHRNTLNYRLQKIEEITHLDFEDDGLCYQILTNAYMLTMNPRLLE